jgi:peptidoglycan/LPS O-acetylase OafA/YrhL
MDSRQKARLPIVVIGACVALTVISFFDEPLSLLGVGLAVLLLGLVAVTPAEDERPHSRVPAILIAAISVMLVAVLVSAKLEASIKAVPRQNQPS